MTTATTARATTVRLPAELHAHLATYCARTGAVRNRVMALALRQYLGDSGAPALPVARSFEPDEVAPPPVEVASPSVQGRPA